MVQVNEETGNRRPISLALPPKEEKIKTKEQKKEADGKDDVKSKSELPSNVKAQIFVFPQFRGIIRTFKL